MHGVSEAVLIEVAAALCLVLAVAFPVRALRYVRKGDELRVLWHAWRPGELTALCIIGIGFLVVSGAAFSLGAVVYPVLWAIVGLHLGGLIAVLIVLVAYNNFKKRQLENQLIEMRQPPTSQGDTS